MKFETRSDRGEVSSWLIFAAGLTASVGLVLAGLLPLISSLAAGFVDAAGTVGSGGGTPHRPEPEPVNCAAREVLAGDVVAIGPQNPAMAAFDQVVIDTLLDGTSPATTASLAVMRDGELVYSRAYSADGTPESNTDSVFRVASVSKTLTATATMTLVESGAVRLDAPIADYLDLGDAVDPRWQDITVEDLLRHQGGWDRDAPGVGDASHRTDAVAAHAGKEPADLQTIDFINYIATLDMQFDPGTETAYSNIGFLLLGQIIEETSGQGYEEYVQQAVLQPLGIDSAQVGSSSQAGSRPNEVTYIDPSFSPYDNIRIEPRAAAGGWTMTAADAARFSHLVSTGRADAVLSDATLTTMFSHDGSGSNMGLGWNVHPVSGNIWHDGSLPGTTALTVNRPDGTTWVLLLNGRPASGVGDWSNAIRRALHTATDAVAAWPTEDLSTTCP